MRHIFSTTDSLFFVFFLCILRDAFLFLILAPGTQCDIFSLINPRVKVENNTYLFRDIVAVSFQRFRIEFSFAQRR